MNGTDDVLVALTATMAPITAAGGGTLYETIALDNELGALAESSGVLKGRIFQGLLECLRSAGADHAQMDNSAKKQGGGGVARECGVEPPDWRALADRADDLRKLVRVKVADDNDLKTARQGLQLCDEFFEDLARYAGLESGSAVDEFEVLRSLMGLSA